MKIMNYPPVHVQKTDRLSNYLEKTSTPPGIPIEVNKIFSKTRHFSRPQITILIEFYEKKLIVLVKFFKQVRNFGLVPT